MRSSDRVRPGIDEGFANRGAVREAVETDYPAIAAIYSESILAGDSTFDTVPPSAADIAARASTFGSRESLLVLQEQGEVVGWAAIRRYSDRPGYRGTCEKSVYLRRDRTGRGFGRILQRALIERCREYGYHHVVSKVLAVNRASVAFNARFGFEIVGVQKEIGHLNGAWHDIVIMQLVLDDVPARKE